MASNFGDSPKTTKQEMCYLKTSLFKSSLEFCDVVSVVIFCPTDGTIMLAIEPNANEYWVPSIKVYENTSWLNHVAKALLHDIFSTNVPITKMLRCTKIWMPTTKSRYISHSTFLSTVNADIKKKSKKLFGKYKGKIRWCNQEEIWKLLTKHFLKSPEILDYICSVSSGPHSLITNPPPEYTTLSNFTEISENVIVTGKNSIYEQIIEASGIDRNAQEILYTEFFLMTFPSIYLTRQNFSKFVHEIGWTKDDVPHLYHSADFYGRGGISFRELLYFLAATEPGTTHGGGSAELRSRYIFRYLDTNHNNLLEREELKNFVVLVRKSKKQAIDPQKVEKELNECYRSIGIPVDHALTMSEFLRAVGELKLRGTSQIFRSPYSIQKLLNEIVQRSMLKKGGNVDNKHVAPENGVSKSSGYELALHSVKMQKTAAVINIEQCWNVENATSFSSKRPPSLNVSCQKESVDKFDQKSKSNELLKALRYLNEINKQYCYTRIETFSFNWGKIDPSVVAKNVASVCTEVKDIVVNEPRLLDIASPVYILGDLHGNISDLLHFEKIFWHVGPALCPCNLLFLGDYVDRGLYSFEVICYLFAYKLQSPRKVFLIRGNHEIKRVQTQWTFEKECKLKFGDKLGTFVFNSINDVFDALPLAAVVDGRVFCCHGGIPPPWLCPVATAINDIPPVLTDPQDQSPLAWELMWNDPIRSKHMTDKVAMELLTNEGFAVNARRGTAHIFSVEALEKFLAANGFTHLIRAHEVVEAGFYLQQKGQLVTVFSSSKYCEGQNLAACILADQGKLRILRLETE